MVNHTQEYVPIVQRAIAAYEGLMKLYAQDVATNQYFEHCLAEARTHRNGLQERLANPAYLADVFKDTFYQSIDHFLDSHRGEYGFDMPNPDPAKAQLAGQYLSELSAIIDDIIRVKNAQKQGL